MNDTANFRSLRASGASPHEVYLAIKASGYSNIDSIRLLREACELSLADAKRAIHAVDPWITKPVLQPGNVVYWEDSSGDDGFYFMQGRVVEKFDNEVQLDELKKLRATDEGLVETPLNGQSTARFSLAYFDKTPVDRLAEALDVWARRLVVLRLLPKLNNLEARREPRPPLSDQLFQDQP